MLLRKTIFTYIAAASISFAVAQTAPTTNPVRQFSLPPVGVAGTETIQINVVNTAANASDGTAASCSGNILFLNAAGATIGTAAPFTVTSGQIFSTHVGFGGLNAASGTRPEIRALVQLTQSSATPRPPCALTYSLEVYDTATNVTHVFVTSTAGGGPGFRN